MRIKEENYDAIFVMKKKLRGGMRNELKTIQKHKTQMNKKIKKKNITIIVLQWKVLLSDEDGDDDIRQRK